MSYSYRAQKAALFTEDGQQTFLRIRDNVHRLLKLAGAVRMQEAMTNGYSDSWTSLAAIDRLVELGELVEIPQTQCAGQHRVFVAAQ